MSTDSLTDVLVFLGDNTAQAQPQMFRCCPLGLQFYSPCPLPLYKLMALRLQMPDSVGPEAAFEVEGIVVHSQIDRKHRMHRIWVMFTNLPEDAAARLKQVSKKTGTQCPHCMNY